MSLHFPKRQVDFGKGVSSQEVRTPVACFPAHHRVGSRDALGRPQSHVRVCVFLCLWGFLSILGQYFRCVLVIAAHRSFIPHQCSGTAGRPARVPESLCICGGGSGPGAYLARHLFPGHTQQLLCRPAASKGKSGGLPKWRSPPMSSRPVSRQTIPSFLSMPLWRRGARTQAAHPGGVGPCGPSGMSPGPPQGPHRPRALDDPQRTKTATTKAMSSCMPAPLTERAPEKPVKSRYTA